MYIYIFSYKSQNIIPKWEDLQSLDFILCLYAVSCIMYLFYEINIYSFIHSSVVGKQPTLFPLLGPGAEHDS